MPTPYFVVGPTAVGKTEIAIRAAELTGAEILNADAFQVYEGLERLTAKPSRADLGRARHHLIGHVPRMESYNVARYHEEATVRLADAAKRGCPVIVVGGSGLYIKALTHGLSPLPPAQPELRAELERMDLPGLTAKLESLDPVAVAVIDRSNKRRLVRAVEVCMITGRRFSELQTVWKNERAPVHGLYLLREKKDLLGRIQHRVDALLEDDSLDEVRQALDSPLSDTAASIIGLTAIRALLMGDATRSACLESIQVATRRYAKRQMTWFRGESFEETVDLTAGMDTEECARFIAGKIGVPSSRGFVH